MIKRTLSPWALLFASTSAILGSGWLFSAFYAAQLAGPAALLSWLIGGVAIIIVAFVFAELCAMIPIMGSSTRIPQFTHGGVVAFVFSWMIWLSYMAMVPAEVQAVVQYLAYYFPGLTYESGALTTHGYVAATILMALVSTINIYSLRWLIRANNILTVIKIIIPLSISSVILIHHFHVSSVIHPDHSSFTPLGTHGIVAAIATGGIIFAFNGFKQACEMAGEAKNPKKSLPLAIIGSVVLCLIIYLFLQMSFLSALEPKNILAGWGHLHFGQIVSPFANIATQEHSSWLLPIIYVGALTGPLAAGLMYASSASRSLYATSKNGYLPKFFQYVTPQGNPTIAIITNFVFGMMLFAPLPGWERMITFLTSLMAVTYAVAPVCLISLRRQCPEQKRPFKLPFPTTWSYFSFYICTLIVYWSGWHIISMLIVTVSLSLVLILVYEKHNRGKSGDSLNWAASTWMWVYLIGIAVISYLGNFGGGQNVITYGWDFALIAVFCAFILWLSVKFKLPSEKAQGYISQLQLD